VFSFNSRLNTQNSQKSPLTLHAVASHCMIDNIKWPCFFLIVGMKKTENLFFENKNYRLYHLPELNILIVEAEGVIQLETAKEAWLIALDKAVECNIARWIADGTHIQMINPKANEWIVSEYFALTAQKLKLKEKRLTATILPPRFYAETNTKEVINKKIVHDAIVDKDTVQRDSRYFQDYESAYEWIANYSDME